MLKQATIDKLKGFGLDVDKLTAAIKAETEQDFDVPEVTVLTTAQLTERDNTKIAEGKRAGETEGEKKGKELAAKAFRTKFAIDEAVGKDIDKVVEAVNAKLSGGDATLKEQITGLLADKQKLQAELDNEKKTSKQASFESGLIGMFPANRSTDLKDAERLALLKMDLQFEEVEGKTVVKRGGEVVKDKTTHAPLSINQVITDYFTERKWTGAAGGNGGRGGGDNNGGAAGGFAGIKSASQFEAEYMKINPGANVLSDEYINALNKQAKDVPDFNMYG